jgi:prepilin-type N-terminal cleavage/methylation domain-containing protein
MTYKQRQSNQKGFTIVELMIALAVLSFILILSTVIMIQIGSLFNKGVTSSNLQNSTQNIMSDVTSAIQFSGSSVVQYQPPSGTPPNEYQYTNNLGKTVGFGAYCIGTARYSYVLGNELGTDSSTGALTPYVLWRDTLTSVSKDPGCTPANMDDTTVGQNPSTAGVSSGEVVAGSGYEMMSNHTQLANFSIQNSSLGNDVYNVTISTAYGDADQFDSTGHCKFSLQSASTAFCSTFSVNSTVEGRIY